MKTAAAGKRAETAVSQASLTADVHLPHLQFRVQHDQIGAFADLEPAVFSLPPGINDLRLRRDGTSSDRQGAGASSFGWWYAGAGQANTGSADETLGAREILRIGPQYFHCPFGPYHFGPGKLTNPCDTFHFWSPHDGGANFLMVDGSVHFLTYSADSIMPALATRQGGEVVELP